MRLGAHVSAAGSLDKAIDRAVEIGAETIQIFGSGPQSWRFKEAPKEQTELFKKKAQARDIRPVFLHAVYLINLGTPVPDNLDKSITSLLHYMKLAAEIGVAAVIFHAGSHRGAGYEGIFQQTVESIQKVLEGSPPGPYLAMENSAGMGHHIGAKFEDIGKIMRAVGSPRMKVCLDTEHAFAAGYNIADKRGIEAAIHEFDRDIGLEHLVAIHANDAKVPLGSGVDRHDNLGEGHIGIQGFEVILAHPAFREVPFLLEVPGFENTGPDKRNMDILKRIRDRLGLTP